MPLDQYDDMARSAFSTLTVDNLAHTYRVAARLMESRDQDRKRYVLIVSALLELLGGQAVIPTHALQNAPGYQVLRTTSGDLLLQSEAITRKKI